MNNENCDIIQDLLPLYCDGVCSEKSRAMILAHIQTCEGCREELRVMELPVDIPGNSREPEAAEAASRAWKKNRRRAFRGGILLAAVLAVLAVAGFLGTHYVRTTTMEDAVGLEKRLAVYSDLEQITLQSMVQKGDYLAVSGCDEEGKWHLGIFARDEVFSNRWRICGSLSKVKPGKLANWNYQTAQGDTVLVCFGAELSEDICGYTFTNSGVTYTCTVEENAVLDFFFIPDAYDRRTHLEPIYRP